MTCESDKKVNTKKYDDGRLQKYGLFNFLTANYSTKSLGSTLLIYFLRFHLLQSPLSPDGLYLYCSDPLAIAPIQEVEKNLCDPEELWTAERLVDKFPVALSQHFPRILVMFE